MKKKFTSMCKLVCNKSGAVIFTLTWLSNIHVEKRKRKRRRCHVKHFTSRNGKQIVDRSLPKKKKKVDRSMNPWPSHSQHMSRWNTIRLWPIGKVFRARLIGIRGEYNIYLLCDCESRIVSLGSFSHCFSSFNFVSWWSFRIQCLIYDTWPTIAAMVYLFF